MLNYSKILREKFENEPLFVNNACAATRRMVKRRQLWESRELLQSLQADVARYEDKLKLQEDSLQEKVKELEDFFLTSNGILQENENKRNRSLRRLGKERRAISALDSEISLLGFKILEQRRIEESLRKECEKSFQYQNYLLQVVDYSKGTSQKFTTLQDILNRYNTLKLVNMDLEKRHQRCELDNERRRRDIIEVSKENSNELLRYNNEIASLQKSLDDYSMQSQRQSTRDGTNPTGQEVMMITAEIAQVRKSVQNILHRFECFTNRSVRISKPSHDETMSAGEQPLDESEATEKALGRIEECIADYSAIINEDYQSS
mmetsp:Transcript_5406/g.7971  ORF Transcript_5406/g.7971 Transcript_5406/m.7971 type:complete len:319 (+) Transcript_5406:224-1180(+)